MDGKTAAYIGLAQRAGAAVYGEDRIEEKLGEISLVLVSSSAPEKYIMRINKKCVGTECVVVDGLNEALHRDNVNAIGIMSSELAKAIIGRLR